MLRRFYGGGAAGGFSQQEAAAVDELVSRHRELLDDDNSDVADLRSEAGYAACSVFLTTLDKSARSLGMEVAPRDYRANFSANYRALFPDNQRHYRVDVLEASIDQHSAIWVNGDKFELSPEAIGHAEALQTTWSELRTMLARWHDLKSDNGSAPKISRAELSDSLKALDIAWAKFECKYISELIAIEEKARALIVNAVNFESKLRKLAKGSAGYREAEVGLIRCVAHLNSVANFKRKGRDDLGVDILESAREVLVKCEGQCGAYTGAYREAAETLASDVVAAYDAMRTYLREVGTCIERVDPHLCNNAGLVARLVDWEESWEVGARYVRQAHLLEAVCDLVAEVKSAQTLAPALTSMIEDCDVELFLVLPRVVMLCFLEEPQKNRSELVRSLLPHRFSKSKDGKSATMLDPDLADLLAKFSEAAKDLEKTSSKEISWALLVKRAVKGDIEQNDARIWAPPTLKLVEDLMREVERWSLELQRHCPEDWNQFSAVLVQCLTGAPSKEPSPAFQV